MRDESREPGTDRGADESVDGSSLRDELLAQFERWGIDLSSARDGSLIASGLFDSLALFNLVLWIEAKTGRAIDPTSVDIAKEWDSVANILRYLQSTAAVSDSGAARIAGAATTALPQSGYRIVRYDASFRHVVAQFQTGLWSPDPELNLRYLEWKHEKNPYSSAPDIYLAFHNEDLVGMRGFYASRWEAGVPARRWPVLVADDLLVREDHRNRGLVTRIMQTAYAGLRDSESQFLFNLSGGRLTVLGSLTMGWRSIGMLKPLGRRTRGAKLRDDLRFHLQRAPYLWRYTNSGLLFGAAERRPFERLDHADNPFPTKAGSAVEIDVRPRPKAMAVLIDRIGHDGRVRHVRDESYFDWRFRNPICEYRFLYVGKDILEGYLVLKRKIGGPGPFPRVNIVDLEATSGAVQAALLEAAVGAGAFAELVVWSATANDQLVKQLDAKGFVPIDQELTGFGCPCILVRATKDECLDEDWRLGETRLLDPANWDMRMLFSMAG
ncbi:MAG: GNAT family N-acetyltransferase [Candidatus Binatia bacterium]